MEQYVSSEEKALSSDALQAEAIATRKTTFQIQCSIEQDFIG